MVSSLPLSRSDSRRWCFFSPVTFNDEYEKEGMREYSATAGLGCTAARSPAWMPRWKMESWRFSLPLVPTPPPTSNHSLHCVLLSQIYEYLDWLILNLCESGFCDFYEVEIVENVVTMMEVEEESEKEVSLDDVNLQNGWWMMILKLIREVHSMWLMSAVLKHIERHSRVLRTGVLNWKPEALVMLWKKGVVVCCEACVLFSYQMKT